MLKNLPIISNTRSLNVLLFVFFCFLLPRF